MIQYYVAIKDLGTQLYSRPQPVAHTNLAIRSFVDEVNRAPTAQLPNELYAHSADFELYLLAEFDDVTGAYTNCLKLLSRGVEVKEIS